MSEALLVVTAAMAFVSVALLAVWVLGERRARPGLSLFEKLSGERPADASYHRLEPESLSANKVEMAVSVFKNGCPCSRVLLTAYGPSQGLTCCEALEAGLRFAKDMNAVNTCGAVTGAFTLLAQRFPGANTTTPDGRAVAREAFSQFSNQFKAKHGTLTCRQLLRQGRRRRTGVPAAAPVDELKARLCPALMHDAAEILQQMLPPGHRAATNCQITKLAA